MGITCSAWRTPEEALKAVTQTALASATHKQQQQSFSSLRLALVHVLQSYHIEDAMIDVVLVSEEVFMHAEPAYFSQTDTALAQEVDDDEDDGRGFADLLSAVRRLSHARIHAIEANDRWQSGRAGLPGIQWTRSGEVGLGEKSA